ncbi:MAG: hypothetical protein ACK559_06540, partial [bacterium]
EAVKSREMALELRQRHLKRQLRPAASLTPMNQIANLNKAKVRGLRLDMKVPAERNLIMEELNAGTQ